MLAGESSARLDDRLMVDQMLRLMFSPHANGRPSRGNECGTVQYPSRGNKVEQRDVIDFRIQPTTRLAGDFRDRSLKARA
jgi:hypothetical protein